jgi:hypothetical protein
VLTGPELPVWSKQPAAIFFDAPGRFHQDHRFLFQGKKYGFVSELTDLQSDILAILDVPERCYS